MGEEEREEDRKGLGELSISVFAVCLSVLLRELWMISQKRDRARLKAEERE